jgi:hypothetical protein
MAGSAATAGPELANMQQFIENALDLVLKVRARPFGTR